jgi:hypothetical protein
LFDPGREKTLDYNRNPSTRSSFEDLSSWNLSNAISVRGLFAAAGSVTGKDPEMWDVSKVADFLFMFA